ncbi:MAG: NADP-dependent isocitrate dehydrogenase [Bacteroidetes bacterium]|nr:MAG: NADP-dependent isocitrate dehydrogenase [Bacteroidota bacterium]
MTDQISKITWTHTDEAPALASYSLLPIVNAFTKAAGVIVETKDISLAARIISAFPEKLSEEQKITDDLAELGEMTQKPETNIIKLPNISASIPQLKDAIKELQSKGYDIPNYPEEVETEAEKQLVQRFAKLLGSAVNPVLRQGNSDRRAAASVKKFAMKNPHKMMKPWGENSKTHVAYMKEGDFYGNEKSIVTEKGIDFKIILEDISGNTQILKDNLKSLDGEILDGTFMSKNALRQFYTEQIEDAKDKDILLSLHLKATMMKVSDPIMFGHAVSIYYKDVLEKYEDIIEELGVNLNNGIGELYDKIKTLPEAKQNEIKAEIKAVYNVRPELAMVDSDNGITNLHAPNKVIVDASMPVVIRDGGKMWGTDGKLHDTKAMIPDRCYATMYQVVIDDCNVNGAFNPAKMGNVSNVGLMAQKAEEYGSHPTTFEIPENGTLKVIDASGAVLMESNVEKGDIWRMSRAKDIPVEDWVKLAVSRAKSTGVPAVFWLDKNRAHDRKVIIKVEKYLKNYDLKGLDIRIMSPDDAMKYTLKRVREGKDTISVSGNVIRDYLTDLFPILELGTSAKMLSIVPLIAGGGLFETGAGGSAPKHVQQFNEEGHLRWDSLGEFLALMVSMEFLADKFNNSKAKVLSETLDKAISKYLENKKSPSRKAGELDNRGTHFYLAQYWAKELNNQNEDLNLKKKFSEIASQLIGKENDILSEIASAEGHSTDIGGYFLPNFEKAEKAMRPSKTLNNIINNLS